MRKPSYRKRTMLGMLFGFSGQSTSVLVLNNYGPTIYKALGYGTRDQLILQSGWITVGVVFTLFGASILDRVGRKPLAMTAFAGTCTWLIVEAAMVAKFAESGTNVAGLRMAVAATYLFLAFYAVGIDVVSIVLYPELFPNHMRSKGMAVCIAVNALADLVYLEVTATAFATIGWKVYLERILIHGALTCANYVRKGLHRFDCRRWHSFGHLPTKNERRTIGGDGQTFRRCRRNSSVCCGYPCRSQYP